MGKRGPVSKQALYSKASSNALEAIDKLVEKMRNGDNDNVQMGAAKAILNKCLPDLKSSNLDADTTKAIIQILGGQTNAIPSDDSNPQTSSTT